MQYIDVFNGDADGLCALVQLRRHNPVSSTLLTGIKRDINLLKRIAGGENTHITALDISFEKNAVDVKRLLTSGAQIEYIDHHQAGMILDHPNLKTDINLSADICTSLIVDKQLQGKYRAWAITAAFGDNLDDKATSLGLASGFDLNELANRNPDKAHAIITDKGDITYLVSVRAPLTRKTGADTLVSQFPTGGGRKAAAGINALPKAMLTTFIDEFERTYQVMRKG